MVNGRKKGHQYECDVAEKFRKVGYAECVTSRMESKAEDDRGGDLCNTGNWRVQCKAVENLGSAHQVLKKMHKDGKTNIVFHKRNNKGTIVCMSEDDFWKILEKLNV